MLTTRILAHFGFIEKVTSRMQGIHRSSIDVDTDCSIDTNGSVGPNCLMDAECSVEPNSVEPECSSAEYWHLDKVSVAFRQSSGQIETVLDGLTLSIPQGQWIALVGKNGSGKSTLGKVLAGILPVSRGSVRTAVQEHCLHGSPVGRHSPQSGDRVTSFNRAALVVFQNPQAQIVGSTVFEDITFGLENISFPPSSMPHQAQWALQKVGLTCALDTPVDQLSGGQKQLLCLASAIAMEPQAIVFDEVTSMLDPASRKYVIQAVRTLHQSGLTVVWITQWLEELAWAQRVVALEGGRIAYDGLPSRFFYGDLSDNHRPEGTAVGGDGHPGDPGDPGEPFHGSDLGGTLAEISPCLTLGFSPPYAVQVAHTLRKRGLFIPGTPILPEDLARSAGSLVPST